MSVYPETTDIYKPEELQTIVSGFGNEISTKAFEQSRGAADI